MARGALAVQEIGMHGDSIDEIAWTAADDTDHHEFANDGKTLLLVKDATGAQTVTIVSVDDPFGRQEDTVITTAAVGVSVSGPFSGSLFNQAAGLVHVDISGDTDMYLAAVKFNPSVS